MADKGNDSRFSMGDKGNGSRFFGLQDDQFEIGAKIGSGGQAVVYECTRKLSGSRYAVKVIDTATSLYQKCDGEHHLRRELRNMQELFHPRIVNLHRAFWENGKCLIVMDLASCGDLHAKIETEVEKYSQPYYQGLGGSEYASKHVATQLLDGMRYMHEHNIIHRDLKLENVLIVQAYPCLADLENRPRELLDVKIADLGYSKMLKKEPSNMPDDSPMTRTHSAVGSPDFVAPEVMGHEYDQKADYWSFGVMLYAMLCGCWPFKIGGKRDLVRDRHLKIVAHIQECESWTHTSAEGKAIVQGLLTISPERRFNADACLRHPWLVGDERVEASPRSSRRRRRSSHGSSSLQAFIALQQGGGPWAAIREVHGNVGNAVDHVDFDMTNGSVRSYGGNGGERESHWILKEDEMIIGLCQEMRPQYLGNAIVFFTSLGRSLPLEGSNAHRRFRFAAPRGTQISGLHFENSHLVGILIEKIVNGKGAVAKISGSAGHAVDKVNLLLRDGSERSYGAEGGQATGPWALDEDECILIVEQAKRDAFLGNSVTFYTSKGNFIRIVGLKAVYVRRFMAPKGHQICGLEFSGPNISRVATCFEDGEIEKEKYHEVHVS